MFPKEESFPTPTENPTFTKANGGGTDKSITVGSSSTEEAKACGDSGHKTCGRKMSPEKRKQILDAALQLFTRQDYHQVRMDHIAEEAGVGKGTLYRYFPDKEKLFFELLNVAISSGQAIIEKEMQSSEPAYVKLCRVVVRLLDFYRSEEPLLIILSHEKVFREARQSKEFKTKRSALRRMLERLLAAGIAEGSFRSDMEPAFSASMLMSSIRVVLRNFGQTRSSGQMAHQVLNLYLGGVLGGCSDVDWEKVTLSVFSTEDSSPADREVDQSNPPAGESKSESSVEPQSLLPNYPNSAPGSLIP